MNQIPYSYSVLRYMHDPGAGEMLNVGVLLCAPSVGFVECRIERHCHRLSQTFVGFDRTAYQQAVQQIENAPACVTKEIGECVEASGVLARILPDQGLAFRYSPSLCGVTPDPKSELEYLFNRYVFSQGVYSTP